MARFDCVLYDFDGTLADSVPLIIKNQVMAYEKVLGRCDRTEEDLKSYIGRPLVDTFAMHDPNTAQKLLEAYLEINIKLLNDGSLALFDGVREELQDRDLYALLYRQFRNNRYRFLALVGKLRIDFEILMVSISVLSAFRNCMEIYLMFGRILFL